MAFFLYGQRFYCGTYKYSLQIAMKLTFYNFNVDSVTGMTKVMQGVSTCGNSLVNMVFHNFREEKEGCTITEIEDTEEDSDDEKKYV